MAVTAKKKHGEYANTSDSFFAKRRICGEYMKLAINFFHNGGEYGTLVGNRIYSIKH